MDPARKKALDDEYADRVRNADSATVRHRWREYLTALYNEDGDTQIFLELRRTPRLNGAAIDRAFIRGEITPRETFNRIRRECADAYISRLNRYGITSIDISDTAYRDLTKDLGIQVLQQLNRIDPLDKAAICIGMARTWHQFVRVLHAAYGLPPVGQIQRNVIPESDAEETVLISDDFETRMTAAQRARWESRVE